ncbi:MAG: hypothetical protein ACTTKL_05370 [Treponema sp.]
MKKGIIIPVLFLGTFLSPLLSCASASLPAPDWFTNYRTVFPDSEYIAQRGRANTEENAKTEAVAQIARYFQTSVNANLKTSVESVSSGERVFESTSIVNDIEAKSQVDLFAVEYTAPYYFKAEKKWYCTAYIEREKAWTQYKPAVDGAKSEFYAMKKNGESESDPFSKIVLYKKTQGSAQSFLKKLEYARLLNAKKESAYSDDRRAVSELPSLIAAEQEKCSVYINIQGDYGNIVRSALAKTLSNNGFHIAKTSGTAVYTANAVIENNAQGTDPVTIYPNLDLKITNKNGKTVFSSQTKLTQKSIAYTLENAQKKAYPVLSELADKEIAEKLNR